MVEIISEKNPWNRILELGFEYDEIYIASYEIGSIYTKLKRHKEKIRCIAIERIMNNDESEDCANDESKITDFLSSLNNRAERVYYKFPNNSFHPKVYYFRNSDSKWLAIVGSPNFTFFAFNRNVETAVAFDQDCPSATEVKKDIERFFQDLKKYHKSIQL